MWTDRTSGLEFYPSPLVFPTDILFISRTEGIPLECPLVQTLPFIDFMHRGFKKNVIVMRCHFVVL